MYFFTRLEYTLLFLRLFCMRSVCFSINQTATQDKIPPETNTMNPANSKSSIIVLVLMCVPPPGVEPGDSFRGFRAFLSK